MIVAEGLADRLTGPWRLVCYMKEFGEQGYFLNFPSKFISEDGLTLWLCYSGNFSQGWNNVRFKANPPGSRYGLVLQEVKLLDVNSYREHEQKQQKHQDPLKGDTNVARKAKAAATSAYEGYRAEERSVTLTAGRVYVTDPEGYLVIAFSNTGPLLATFGQYGYDESSITLPTGIDVDPQGYLYVTDTDGQRVIKFEPLPAVPGVE